MKIRGKSPLGLRRSWDGDVNIYTSSIGMKSTDFTTMYHKCPAEHIRDSCEGSSPQCKLIQCLAINVELLSWVLLLSRQVPGTHRRCFQGLLDESSQLESLLYN